MPLKATQVANWFVTRAQRDGRVLSIMSLLKLVYFAHGWNLEIKKTPLIGENIEAWQYGPVVPEVYNAFRWQGVSIQSALPDVQSLNGHPSEALLENIYKIYGKLSPFRLSELTHEPGGPWDIATKLGGWYADIPNELIQGHFEKKRLEAKANART